MSQHGKRFDAVGAAKGTNLAAVVGALKGVADIVEEHYDANSPQVISAMQRFEMGLNLLKGAPELPGAEEQPKPKRTRGGRTSKKDAPASEKDASDTPETGEVEETPTSS